MNAEQGWAQLLPLVQAVSKALDDLAEGSAMTRWLDKNVRRCQHGYVESSCGECCSKYGRSM